MRAVAVPEFRATPQVMQLPVPNARKGELRVRVEFAGINPFDRKIADGILDGHRPHVFPLVLGVDAAGVVESTGSGATRFQVGDRVAGQFLHDPVGTGTYAELTTVPETNAIVMVPATIGSDRAAALPTAGMTALDALDSLGLASGASLVIVGASGGVGSFAVELAAARGIRVTAVARGASGDRLRALGAERVVDVGSAHPQDDIREDHPNGVEGLLDVMSDRQGFARWASLVRRGGTAATTTYVADVETLVRQGVQSLNIDLQPSAALMERLMREVAERSLPIPLDRTIPLAEAPVVLDELKKGGGRGKTVIDVHR